MLILKNGTYINANIMETVLANAKKVNSNLKRIYFEVNEDGTLKFLVRRRNKNGDITTTEVYSVHIGQENIVNCILSDSRYNGYPYCISIIKYNNSLTDPDNIGGILIGQTNDKDISLSCPIQQ